MLANARRKEKETVTHRAAERGAFQGEPSYSVLLSKPGIGRGPLAGGPNRNYLAAFTTAAPAFTEPSIASMDA